MTRDFRQLFSGRIGRAFSVAMAASTLSVASATEARAACLTTDFTSRLSPPALQFERVSSGRRSGESESDERSDSIVGLWRVAFLVGNGPDVAFEGFQQWHERGTEVMVDNSVPPSLGNVCLGVWKQTDSRTFSLRHTTFNWDANGSPPARSRC